MAYLVIVPVAYLLGSVPWGLLLVRLVRGLDVRQFGSGNIGATNVLRTAGVPSAILVLALDGGKAALAVVVARLLTDGPMAEVVAGGVAVIGHNWPVFLRFKGGKGVAPATGAALVFAPLAVAAGLAVFLPSAAISRYVSLATLGGVLAVVIALGVGTLVDYYPVAYLAYGLSLGTIVVVRHRNNIRRLLMGVEHRLGRPSK